MLKKVELFKIVANADEETTSKLIEYANWLQKGVQPTADEVAFYEKRSEDVFASGEKGFTKEESLTMLRQLLK